MRKVISLALTLAALLTLVACGNANTPQSNNTPAQSSTPTPPSTTESTQNPEPGNESPNNTQEENANMGNSNILIVYFSVPETTDPNNMTRDEDNSTVVINGEVLGNTQYIAYLIEEHTGGDIFRIEPKTPYPTNHSELLDVGSKEKSENARPELLANVENIDQYDVIFLGYPNWNADLPMILYSFLESVDLSGKTIVPFNTHGGSGFSRTISTIADLQPNATVITDGYTVSRDRAADAKDDVIAWLTKLGY